ncbi:MAG: BrnT family toxin [Candidatus Sulfotelmatobacter sp.]
MLFEWDESKRQSNLAKHHIDFQDAIRIFESPVFEKATRGHGEDRVLAIGLLEGVEIVVVYVIRGKRRRIISARRAHRDEREAYANHLTLALQRRH